MIHAALLPRLIGVARARWLVMTGATIDAATALQWGLIDAVAAPGELDAEVDKLVYQLLECGAEALAAQKVLIRKWEELPLRQAIDESVSIFWRAFLSDEPKRYMQRFMDRPRWDKGASGNWRSS